MSSKVRQDKAYVNNLRALLSIRLVILEISILILVLVAATLIPQVPLQTRGDPVKALEWLENKTDLQASITAFLSSLSIFTVSSSWWFIILWLSIALSVFAYLITRFPSNVISSPRRRYIHQTYDFGSTEPLFVASRIRAYLSSLGFSITLQVSDNSLAIYATKHWKNTWLLWIAHLGFILLLLGVILNSIYGWQITDIPVPNRERLDIPRTDLSVVSNGLSTSWDPLISSPIDYIARIDIYEGDKKVVSNYPLRVNNPIAYEGISLHLRSFGQAAIMRVYDTSGRLVFDGGIPLTSKDDLGRSYGVVQVGNYDLKVSVPPENTYDPDIPAGTVKVDLYKSGTSHMGTKIVSRTAPQTIDRLRVMLLREDRYVGLSFSYQPFSPAVWLGGGLLLVGSAGMFIRRKGKLVFDLYANNDNCFCDLKADCMPLIDFSRALKSLGGKQLCTGLDNN